MDVQAFIDSKAGEPIPEVDPADVKAVWELHKEAEKRLRGKQFAIGNDVVTQACKSGADILAVRTRTARLAMIMDVLGDQLANWIKDGELDEALFRAAATTPMKYMAVGVVHHGFPFDVEELLRRVRGE